MMPVPAQCGGRHTKKERNMTPIDIVIIVTLALIVGGIVSWIIVSKKKGKNIGCDCSGGCSGCTSKCGSCQGCPSKTNGENCACEKEESKDENV